MLFAINRLFVPFERWQLTGWWLLSGVSKSIDAQAAEHIKANPELKSHVLNMLGESKHTTINSQVALYFASLFPNDPDIKEQLHLLSNSQANVHVKCQTLKLLKHTHSVTIYSADDPTENANRFTMVGDYKCDSH